LIPSPQCRLPELPDAIEPKIVEATEDYWLISKADITAIAGYVGAQNDWITAASSCLKAGQ
jgi:hypothetical protein